MLRHFQRTPTKVVDESPRTLKALAEFRISESELMLRRQVAQYLLDPKKAPLTLIAEKSVTPKIAAAPKGKIEYPNRVLVVQPL